LPRTAVAGCLRALPLPPGSATFAFAGSRAAFTRTRYAFGWTLLPACLVPPRMRLQRTCHRCAPFTPPRLRCYRITACTRYAALRIAAPCLHHAFSRSCRAVLRFTQCCITRCCATAASHHAYTFLPAAISRLPPHAHAYYARAALYRAYPAATWFATALCIPPHLPPSTVTRRACLHCCRYACHRAWIGSRFIRLLPFACVVVLVLLPSPAAAAFTCLPFPCRYLVCRRLPFRAPPPTTRAHLPAIRALRTCTAYYGCAYALRLRTAPRCLRFFSLPARHLHAAMDYRLPLPAQLGSTTCLLPHRNTPRARVLYRFATGSRAPPAYAVARLTARLPPAGYRARRATLPGWVVLPRTAGMRLPPAACRYGLHTAHLRTHRHHTAAPAVTRSSRTVKEHLRSCHRTTHSHFTLLGYLPPAACLTTGALVCAPPVLCHARRTRIYARPRVFSPATRCTARSACHVTVSHLHCTHYRCCIPCTCRAPAALPRTVRCTFACLLLPPVAHAAFSACCTFRCGYLPHYALPFGLPHRVRYRLACRAPLPHYCGFCRNSTCHAHCIHACAPARLHPCWLRAARVLPFCHHTHAPLHRAFAAAQVLRFTAPGLHTCTPIRLPFAPAHCATRQHLPACLPYCHALRFTPAAPRTPRTRCRTRRGSVHCRRRTLPLPLPRFCMLAARRTVTRTHRAPRCTPALLVTYRRTRLPLRCRATLPLTLPAAACYTKTARLIRITAARAPAWTRT